MKFPFCPKSARGRSLTLAAAVMSLAFAGSALADTFGCEVLLCENQNWSAIADCVAPMTAALAELRKNGDWPTCPEANVTTPSMSSIQDPSDGAWLSLATGAVLPAAPQGNTAASAIGK